MASTFPIEKMSVEEKLQAMESLWDDLCSRADAIRSPAWHASVLEARDSRQAEGAERFEDWETAKKSIKNKVS